jgi:Tol biopolymer transport system component
MNQRFRTPAAVLALTIALLACVSVQNFVPSPGQPTSSADAVSTAVALTFQALTPPVGDGVTETAEPAAGLLPHSLYYQAADSAGRMQVFRMEKDGTTTRQITTEPVEIRHYGVSPVDGSVAYVANNQLVLLNADGTGRRVLVEGGPVDEINPFLNSLTNPVFSPDGQTIAYGYQGLNFYSLTSGMSERTIEDQVDDMGGGMILPVELYRPEKYSPDGSRLLITLGYYEGASAAFYDPQTKSLARLQNDQGALVCCDLTQWSADGTKVHSANPSMGMFSAGLWETDPATGMVTTLLASDWDSMTINHAKHPYLAPDGRLYYFFHSSNNPDLSRIPLQVVRSAPDGVTGREVIVERTFELMNEALWSPDASMVVVAIAPSQDIYQGGQAEIVYLDGRPNVELAPFAQQMKWGP